MTKLYILTAEMTNFVPVELLKAAQATSIEAKIINIGKIVVDESIGSGGLWYIEDEGISRLVVDSSTIVIPRLNEHHLDTKIGILKKMENMGAKLLNTAEGMELCNDKLMSQVVLNKAGIETPASWVIQDADSFDMVIGALDERKSITFPIIVKTFRGTHGIGVMKLDSKSSLVSVGQTLLKEGIDFMIQAYIKHEQSCRIIMKGQELLAANLRGQPKDKDEFRTNSHLGSETQPYEPSEEELALGRKIVELFGTTFCAIDYIVVDTVSQGEELPAMEGLADGHVHVFNEDDTSNANYVRFDRTKGRWVAMKTLTDLHEESVQKIIQTQLTEGKRIVVLEVNGSPGLEAMSKNWPDRNLAAEVVEFAMKAETPQEVEAPIDNETMPAEELPPEPVEAQDVPTEHLRLVEPITIHRLMEDIIDAKVDTGATTSSLHAENITVNGQLVSFTRNGTTYRIALEKMKHVKAHDSDNESQERPIVKFDVTVHGKRVDGVEFSLNDREHMKYEALIGRNLIEALGMPITAANEEE